MKTISKANILYVAQPGIAKSVNNLMKITSKDPMIEDKIKSAQKIINRIDNTSRYTENELIP